MIAMQGVDQVPQFVDRGGLLMMDGRPARGPASLRTRARRCADRARPGAVVLPYALAIEPLGHVFDRDHRAARVA